MPSAALKEFRGQLDTVRALLKLERGYRDPPVATEIPFVEGLRGAAAVLMVAGFENFVRAAIEEHLYVLTRKSVSLTLKELRWNNAYKSFKHAMDGLPGRAKHKHDRVADMIVAGGLVAADTINPGAFSNTRGNPSAERVKDLFKAIEYPDLYGRIRVEFERDWRQTVAPSFIQDKLDEIVDRRHQVAHTGKALNISRADLREGERFLRVLGTILDKRLGRHVRLLRRIK